MDLRRKRKKQHSHIFSCNGATNNSTLSSYFMTKLCKILFKMRTHWFQKTHWFNWETQFWNHSIYWSNSRMFITSDDFFLMVIFFALKDKLLFVPFVILGIDSRWNNVPYLGLTETPQLSVDYYTDGTPVAEVEQHRCSPMQSLLNRHVQNEHTVRKRLHHWFPHSQGRRSKHSLFISI